MGQGDEAGRRAGWSPGAGEPASSRHEWLSLSDDELLYQIESLDAAHDRDDALVEVLCSDRHFFIRQEAAKKICDQESLKPFAGDRHIGQILVRGLNRADDVAYLERLLVDSRHIEVKKAAEAQLRTIVLAKMVPRIAKRP